MNITSSSGREGTFVFAKARRIACAIMKSGKQCFFGEGCSTRRVWLCVKRALEERECGEGAGLGKKETRGQGGETG